VYRHEIDEKEKVIKLWVRRKRGNSRMVCSGCGRRCGMLHEALEREVRDLPWGVYRATVVVEVYRVRCPDCGIRREKVEQLPSKAPYSKRFEEMIGNDCGSASARQVAHKHGLAESTVRAMDLRYLERWAASRIKPPLRQMGVDEIHMGKIKFVTVVSNLESGEPVWFGLDRRKETLDEFFTGQLKASQRGKIESVCQDMWAPFAASVREHAPRAKIVYDKFHVIGHANKAVDEVRRAEFYRQGGAWRGVMKGKRWLLLTRWKHLSQEKQQLLNRLFQLNRRVMKAYLMKEQLEGLWQCAGEKGMLDFFRGWCRQLRWQRLKPMEKVAGMIVKHMEGIVNYYRVSVRFGVVEAINSNLRALIRRGRGYSNLRYLLLKAQFMAAQKLEFITLRKAA
jgi:transposase